MSSSERLKRPAAVPMGRSVQWKNSWGRTNHILSWSNSDSATSYSSPRSPMYNGWGGIVAKQSCSGHKQLSICIYKEYHKHIHVIYNTYTMYIIVCTHLDISSSKSMAFHVEWVTPGAHNPAIQIWLELYCLEGVNIDSARVRYEAGLQNSIECGSTPGFRRVRSERHIQLLRIIVHNPLSPFKFLGKKLQHGMAATVQIFIYYSTAWGGCCLARLAACPDTLRYCCFRSIMSSPGAESCPWRSIYPVYRTHKNSISKQFSSYIKAIYAVYHNILICIYIVYTIFYFVYTLYIHSI